MGAEERDRETYRSNADESDELAKVKRALDENHRVLESIVKHVPGGVFQYSAETDDRFGFVSENMLSHLGYTREEFDEAFHGHFSEMIYAEDRERVLEDIEEQVSHGMFDTCQYRIQRKDGSLIWVHDEGHLVTDEDGHRWFYVTIVDITQSINETQQLNERKSQLEMLVENIPAGIRVLRKTGNDLTCIAANPYCADLIGIPVDKLLGPMNNRLTTRLHPDDIKAYKHAGRQLIGLGKNTGETFRIFNSRAGVYQWVHVDGRVSTQADGSLLIYLNYSDASAQKHAEENFDRTMQQLIEGNPQTLCSFKLNLTRNSCESGHGSSPSIQSLLMAATAVKLFDNIASLISDPFDRTEFRKQFRRTRLIESFEKGEENISATYRRRMDDGDIHWVTTRLNMIRNPYTGDIEAVATSYDSEDEMLENQIIQHVTNEDCDFIGIIYPDEEMFKFHNVNSRMEDLILNQPFPYTQYIRNALDRLADNEDRDAFAAQIAIDNIIERLGSSNEFVFSFRTVEDDVKLHKNLAYSYLDGRKGDILVIQSDTTTAWEQEHEQMERLQEALDIARCADEAKSDFLSRMSHDIRTPMNGIIGMARMAREYDNPPETEECLDKIDTSSQFLLELVNDILDLSKVDSGTVTLHLEPYRPQDFLAYLEAVIRPSCESKGIDFTVTTNVVDDMLPLMDILRTNQIVFNLLSNAVKFTPESGKVDLLLDEKMIDATRMDMTAIISDTGIGMSEEFQKVLFEPFRQEGGTKPIPGQGAGLGLSIAKKMIDLMGGTIEVVSEPGRGTSFHLHGILDCVRTDSVAERRTPSPASSKTLSGKRVLLVEDHPLNTEIAVALLEKVGMLVTAAGDGKHGLDEFVASPDGYYDAVLMDIRMPVMDGYETARAIRALERADAEHVPIIAMTADAFDEDIHKALDAGMDAHIAKPIDPDILYLVLTEKILESGCEAR